MADVSISSVASSNTARGMRAVAFTRLDDQVGYFFFSASTSAGLFYTKTTDGGATWGTAVLVSAAVTPGAFDIWADWWTPGDTGTLIHFWSFDVTADDVIYRTLDTASDTLSTAVVVFAGATSVLGRGVFVSGTKTRSGYLYCAYDIDAGAEKGFVRSTTGGDPGSWGSVSSTFIEATLDEAMLFPASNTGDDNDCWALYHDASADQLTLKMWDSSAGAQVESVLAGIIENVTDLVGQRAFSGTIRHSDGALLCSWHSERDTATADHWVGILTDLGGGSYWFPATTAIALNIDDNYHSQIFVDQTTDDIYVAFNGIRTGAETLGTTTKVYYVKSTDDGATWSAGSTAYMEGAAAAVVQVWTPLMGPRFYVGWRVGSTLIGNKVNSLTFAASGYTLVAEKGVFTLSGQAARLLVGRAVKAGLGSFVLTGQAVGLEVGRKVLAETGAFNVTGQTVLLKYNRKVLAGLGAFSLTGIAARLLHNKILLSERGVFALNGQAAALSLGKTISAGRGMFVLTGQDVTFRLTRRVVAGVGTYVLTGIAARLLYGREVLAQTGVYTLTGQDVQLKAARKILATGGSFTLAGQAARLLRGRVVKADRGIFTMTGIAARLLHIKKLLAERGIFVLTGQEVNLIYDQPNPVLQAGRGIFVLSGQAALLKTDRRIIAQPGAYSLVGKDVQFKVTRKLNAEVGQFNLTGQNARLLHAKIVHAEIGTFLFLGEDSQYTRHYRLNAETGSFVLTGQDAELTWVRLLFAVLDGEVEIYSMFDGEVEITDMMAGDPDVFQMFDGEIQVMQEEEGEEDVFPMLTAEMATLPGQ